MDPTPDPPGGDRRPTLARPPADRYRPPAPAAAPAPDRPPPTLARRLALAALVAGAGAAVMALLGGVLALTAGLLVVALVLGLGVGRVMAPAPGSAALRRGLAAVLAADAIVLGHVGIWLVALAQGGGLGLLDYLAQTRGLLVIVELAIGTLAAWWSAR